MKVKSFSNCFFTVRPLFPEIIESNEQKSFDESA